MPVDLSQAIEHHRRGRLDAATRAYEAALAEEPDHADALHWLGLVAIQRGDPRRAVALIGRAIAIRPDDPDSHASLAEALRWAGDLDGAIASCRESLRLRPESPGVLCNLGATLAERGEVDAAIARYRDALRLDPGTVIARNNLGNALRVQGDEAGAIEQFRLAVALDPAAAEARSNLGQALLDRGEPAEALVHCEEAVRLRPGLAAARANLGNVLRDLGRFAEAKASLAESIRLDPDRAAAHAGLGGVLEDLGESDAATASHREALRLDPRHAGSLARLATRLRSGLPDLYRATIEELLADPGLPASRRYPLQFGLAQVLDALGDFDRAATLSIEANALQLADLRARGRGYDPEAHRAFVDRLIAAFTPAFFARARGLGHGSERPVFIVGMPRSGTTLTEQILAGHPRVCAAGELRLARATFDLIPRATGRPGDPLDGLPHLDRDSAQSLARHHLDALAAIDGRADRVVDKMPENTLHLGLIAALFPRATLIHCRRDARDVALSCWMTHFASVRWASDPAHIGSRFAEYRRLMDHWREVLPTRLIEVDYEATVADPEATSRELVARCGLDWDPACLDFHKASRPVRTASVAQVRRPIYGSSVCRWRNYERSLPILFDAMG